MCVVCVCMESSVATDFSCLSVSPCRSYWVASACWSPGGLFLACVLKRGSLLMLMRLGRLLTLSTTGCDIDFGPAHFLPLHPLVTYRYEVSFRWFFKDYNLPYA